MSERHELQISRLELLGRLPQGYLFPEALSPSTKTEDLPCSEATFLLCGVSQGIRTWAAVAAF